MDDDTMASWDEDPHQALTEVLAEALSLAQDLGVPQVAVLAVTGTAAANVLFDLLAPLGLTNFGLEMLASEAARLLQALGVDPALMQD